MNMYGWDRGKNCLWCGESGRCRCDHTRAVKDRARLLAAAPELYAALKYMNHVEFSEGYCICPLKNGAAPDDKHATICADARKALRNVEGKE